MVFGFYPNLIFNLSDDAVQESLSIEMQAEDMGCYDLEPGSDALESCLKMVEDGCLESEEGVECFDMLRDGTLDKIEANAEMASGN